MKVLLSSLFLVVLFSANASEVSPCTLMTSDVQTEAVDYPGDGKKKNRKNKRMNKKRKRKCHKWARRSFAN
jgi:hypothetical protein